MDITKTIEEIRRHKESVERAIASLEELQGLTNGAVPLKKRRGRKSMSAEERRVVSTRMKNYWASRLKQAM